MKKAILINAEYISSKRKPFQGTQTELQRELNNGWELAGENNDSYILVKPAQAIFVFKDENGTYRYNMREDILDLLGKQRLTEKSFRIFKSKIETGNISIYIDEDGYYTLR